MPKRVFPCASPQTRHILSRQLRRWLAFRSAAIHRAHYGLFALDADGVRDAAVCLVAPRDFLGKDDDIGIARFPVRPQSRHSLMDVPIDPVSRYLNSFESTIGCCWVVALLMRAHGTTTSPRHRPLPVRSCRLPCPILLVTLVFRYRICVRINVGLCSIDRIRMDIDNSEGYLGPGQHLSASKHWLLWNPHVTPSPLKETHYICTPTLHLYSNMHSFDQLHWAVALCAVAMEMA
jgi:hypothetical protein